MTGNPIFDAIGTLAIGVLLVVVAVFIGIEVKALLIGQSVDIELRDEIRAFIEAASGGRAPVQPDHAAARTRRDGVDQGRDAARSFGAGLIEAINAVEHALKARFPEIRWSFFEPDAAD